MLHREPSEREARIRRHARDGFRLARSDDSYRDVVISRLTRWMIIDPSGLFAAQPLLWALALGVEHTPKGQLAKEIADGAATLREYLLGDAPSEDVLVRWKQVTHGKLDLSSTLRSHPFPDLLAWSLRPPSAA